MDWLLNNLDNVVIPIIIAVLYLVGSAAQKKSKKKKAAHDQVQTQANPDEARRVSEIQAEIRRKIAERTGRVPPPLQAAPSRPVPAAQPSVPRQKLPETARKPTPTPSTAQAFQAESYKREIEAKMAKVRELEAKAKLKPVQAKWGTQKRQSVPKGQLRAQLFQDLAHPLGQRKAILVSEILGTPVGIKGPSHWKSNV
ncbi:MAG: hypothetical protein O7C75_12420 [Verrucomicrobia bacterium]|nr:hypothetical protein [Verrucomicrobiota bacterium]